MDDTTPAVIAGQSVDKVGSKSSDSQGDASSVTNTECSKQPQGTNTEEGEEASDEEDNEPLNSENYQPPSDEIIKKLVTQAEFYFSDANVLKDKFLLKHIQKTKSGFVSLKLLSSFRRMQTISKNWRDLAYALRNSPKLELNAAGTKIRRRDPIPQWDDSVYDRTVIAINMQMPEVSVNAVKNLFGKCGDVTLVRVLQPGKNLPDDLRQFAPKHPELSTRICAIIEFSKADEAQKALKELGGKDDWRGMHVLPLVGRNKQNSKDADGAAVDIPTDGASGHKEAKTATKSLPKGKENVTKVIVDSSPSHSPSTHRRKQSSRSGNSRTGSVPDKYKLDAYGSSSPSRSPVARRRSPRPHVTAGSGDEMSDSKSAPKPIPGRMQRDRGTPSDSPDLRSKNLDGSPLSCSPVSLGASPWVRRRALMEGSDVASSPTRNLIAVTRQPRGPDGSKGFTSLRT